MSMTYNHNETPADDDVEAHGVSLQDNESVDEDDDVAAHGVSLNVNETASEDND
jgi:hypothetical protein